MIELPLVIMDRYACLFGILRSSPACQKLMIILPAATGTRIGPQRIYVELARSLLCIDIASFTVDLPPHGDSYDNEPAREFSTYREYLLRHYEHYLDIIISWFRLNYNYNEFILLSISTGCLNVLQYAENNLFSRVVLLSPNLMSTDASIINKKNLRAYREKLFRLHTWKKLLTLQLSVGKIIRNTFIFSTVARKAGDKKTKMYPDNRGARVNILAILGEYDENLRKNQLYWLDYRRTNKCASYAEKIIRGADHSFFGWQFKEDVISAILLWLKETNFAGNSLHNALLQ